jgi:hypothetical protein
LLDELTSVQLSEWEAYDRLEPIGTWWQDYRIAYLCSFFTNVVNQLYHKDGEPVPELQDVYDYMPVYDRSELKKTRQRGSKQQSVTEIKNTLLGLVSPMVKDPRFIEKDGKRIRIKPPIKKKI